MKIRPFSPPIPYQNIDEECITYRKAQRTTLDVSFWNGKDHPAQLENKILLDTSRAFCYKFCGFLVTLRLSFQ